VSATRIAFGRAGWACIFLLSLSIALAAGAADVLFPSPLHITREIVTPFSSRKTIVDEYCHGNRIVSVSGRRTAIADHAKRQITVIDFAAGTYSVTTFEDIARANAVEKMPSEGLDAVRDAWTVEASGGRVVASRPGRTIEAERRNQGAREVIQVTADQQLMLSRDAVDALLGTGYPNRRDERSDVVLAALRSRDRSVSTNESPAPSSVDRYSLPLEQTVSIEIGGDVIETRNVVLRVGNELPPPDLLVVPPGAKLVESDLLMSRRLLEETENPARARTP
jgi:hypothetical protein